MPIEIEVAVASVQDAQAAQAGGANRLELCAALELGGLTPSLGTFLSIKQSVSMPIVAMLRPRAGGFNYCAADVDVMARDAELFLSHGAAGIVFGFLTPEHTLDRARIDRFVRLAGRTESVVHRAFDLTVDPFASLELLIDLGVSRVLTSGQERSAPEGAELIRRLIDRAAGRIQILPGGGITPENATSLIARTGASQLHGSFSHEHNDPAHPVCGGVFQATGRGRIELLRAALQGI
jgi:copper homeostasis protein